MASCQLNQDNFIYFFKDFIATFPIDVYYSEYEKLIFMNKHRFYLMANGLMNAYRKI